MWKRLQGYGREKERQQIGHPQLIETTYDEDRLRNNPNVVNAQDVISHSYAQPYAQFDHAAE